MGTNGRFDIFPVVDLIAFENRDVKKNVGAIHVSGRLSLMQRKVSNVLLMNAYEEMNDKDIHRIPVSDLAELVGFDSNNREFLKNSVKSLMSLVLEWNILDNKSQEKDWEAMPMLSYARIKGGYCMYSYPKALKDKLYNPAATAGDLPDGLFRLRVCRCEYDDRLAQDQLKIPPEVLGALQPA